MLRLDGKTAFVSGAGSVGQGWGNGKATAVLLARQGAHIFGTDVREEAAAETRDLIRGEGGTRATRACDMACAAEVEAAVAECRAKFGRIDIFVNDMGDSAPGNAATMTEEVWDAQMAYNLKTMFLTCKYVLAVMEKQASGAIINLSSIAGLRMSHERAHIAYSTAKLPSLSPPRLSSPTKAFAAIR
jgi:NAD(P)-dependent dehydrogenase (short-subunit alcohol dehydrogenase family)